MDFPNSILGTQTLSTAAGRAFHDEDALQRCALSNSFLKAGDYEGAAESLEGFWRGACERPAVEGLDARAAAEVLLQAGRLTSAFGGARRIGGAQESAKNLLSEGAGLFERLGDAQKVAEAHAELGLCYWREGAFEEARAALRMALALLPEGHAEQRAVALIRHALVETSSKQYASALALLDEAAPLVEASDSDALRGCLHNERAIAYRALAYAGDAEMLDRAFVEYAAASYYYEQVGHTRYQANTENNLAHLFSNAGRYEEAHEHLGRALALFGTLKDTHSIAQCNDTLARVLTAEGKFVEAETAALTAVRVFEAGDRHALLAEALTTLGAAQARGGRPAEAHRSLVRAFEVADATGDRSGAGMAALTLAEELGSHLSRGELYEAFERAHSSFAGTRNPDVLSRLTACARRALELATIPRLEGEEAEASERYWEGFSLKSEVLRYEAELISRALRDAGGVVSHAAKLLGFKHHQTFVALLNNRHKDLLSERRPVIPRRRSIIRRPRRQVRSTGKKG